jgi:hypothetical protein
MFQRSKPKLQLINPMPQQRQLCLEADLAFGAALDSG